MKKAILFFGFGVLILFEILRVYLIMPMPGSQQSNSIDLAYFLGKNKNLIRLIGFLLIIFPVISIVRSGTKKDKIILASLSVVYLALFYVFTFQMEADKMFYQPSHKYFSDQGKNKIKPDKLVIGVEMDGASKAYPIQLIGYHHQVADTINGKPVMVTYCTVCRTGRVYSPLVNGKTETFRLVGMDHFNAMFEDATTKSWWRQVTGECIAGPLKGQKLTEIQSEQVSLSAWLRAHPTSQILQPDEKFKEIFEKMDVYDKGKSKSGLTRRDSLSWQKKSWVIGVSDGNVAKAYDWNELVEKTMLQDSIQGLYPLIILENDTSSFHVYDRKLANEILTFSKQSENLIDSNTGSTWNYDGDCVDGKLKGSSLKKISAYQEFLHSWEYFHPNSSR
ncbi:MAG TPA: DUF3179 domain-containing (seleno)protein [Chitinophagaceae bacterium]|nr:DUF3179 domain-containing (seleno)protein [Chitinophagaceae bacterium]